nr:4Fe-4S cluster-binding domain-containing protein [Clostridioides mangenotii]
MKLRLSSSIISDSIVDGPGLRMVIWTQGCIHNCKDCHNPQTHDLCGGFEIETNEIIDKLKTLKLQKGITLSGGEPFCNPKL